MLKGQIQGYYDYYCDKMEYSRIGKAGVESSIDTYPNDIHRFFSSKDKCPFCRNVLTKVFHAHVGYDVGFEGTVWECDNCGWWRYDTHFYEEDDSVDSIHGIYTDEKYYAIAKSFDVTDKELPIEVLKAELSKKPDLLYNIHPYKFEKLCQDILKGVYDCEVHHVGQKGDGGTDLIVLESAEPILVQVKRRTSADYVELIKSVREFVGTLFIEDSRKGIYISTAKRFSAECNKTAMKLMENRKLDYFELIDYDRLFSLIKISEVHEVWRTLVDFFCRQENATIYDYHDRRKQTK